MNQGDRLAVILFGLNKKFGAELVFNSRHVNTADDAASMAASSPYPSMVAYNSVSKMEKFDNWAVGRLIFSLASSKLKQNFPKTQAKFR